MWKDQAIQNPIEDDSSTPFIAMKIMNLRPNETAEDTAADDQGEIKVIKSKDFTLNISIFHNDIESAQDIADTLDLSVGIPGIKESFNLRNMAAIQTLSIQDASAEINDKVYPRVDIDILFRYTNVLEGVDTGFIDNTTIETEYETGTKTINEQIPIDANP
jgi:hypothetical protein